MGCPAQSLFKSNEFHVKLYKINNELMFIVCVLRIFFSFRAHIYIRLYGDLGFFSKMFVFL